MNEKPAEIGDMITTSLLPRCVMEVLDVRDCETDANRSEPHRAYKVKDPKGFEDWLCAYDITHVGV